MNHQAYLRLIAFAESRLGKPFEWGACDCYSLIWEALTVIYGVHSLPLPTYRDEAEAYRIALTYDYEAEFRQAFRVIEVARGFEQDGDLVMIERGDFLCLHLVIGPKFFSVSQEKGVCLLPRRLFQPYPRKTLRLAPIG